MEPVLAFLVALSFATLAALIASGIFIYGTLQLLRTKKAVHEPRESKVAESAAPTDHTLRDELAQVMLGDVTDESADRTRMSRDTSIFVRVPEVVVYPKNSEDVRALVKKVSALKSAGRAVAIAARSAGTCMSGGPLTNSIAAVFTKYMNKVVEVGDGYAIAEPGVYYRDFEKATIAHGNQLMPAYPASRELAALGGMVNNNAGGERTLEFGKVSDYVESLEVVLADGTQTTIGPLTKPELVAKKQLPGLEGQIYRQMDELLTTHADLIAQHRPKVSKNSAGYALWDVRNPATGTFNLAKLLVGSQGTLALTTSIRFRLITDQGFRSMLVVFLDDLASLPAIVQDVLEENPESFESYDRHTLSLAIRFLPGLMTRLGVVGAMKLGWSFLPELRMALVGGLPKLVLMAEFSEDSREAALAAAKRAQAKLTKYDVQTSLLPDEASSKKYWTIRRESFALLRKHSRGLTAAPFIDDFVVPPSSYPTFLPKLDALLAEYKGKFVYTIAGHIGNGNFHIIPLMDLSKPEIRAIIPELSPKVYSLVIEHGGSTTGEHNDGIIRTPYLPQMFGTDMVKLFEETKRIFDPQNIFNPGKKVGGTFADIERYMLNG